VSIAIGAQLQAAFPLAARAVISASHTAQQRTDQDKQRDGPA
jgi:hypothetical protein